MRPIEQALSRRRIAWQSMNAQPVSRFDWKKPSVKLLTMHSAKGLEFPFVFVAGLQALPVKNEPIDDELRLLYVAMTRATRELTLSAHRSSAVVERVRQSLDAVTRQFQAAE
jgi:superfamily I DNA/RNA helicase